MSHTNTHKPKRSVYTSRWQIKLRMLIEHYRILSSRRYSDRDNIIFGRLPFDYPYRYTCVITGLVTVLFDVRKWKFSGGEKKTKNRYSNLPKRPKNIRKCQRSESGTSWLVNNISGEFPFFFNFKGYFYWLEVRFFTGRQLQRCFYTILELLKLISVYIWIYSTCTIPYGKVNPRKKYKETINLGNNRFSDENAIRFFETLKFKQVYGHQTKMYTF